MEILLALYAITILILAWAIYRLNRQVITTREKVIRLGKRLNDTLYKITRTPDKGQKTQTATSCIDFVEPDNLEKSVICPNCKSKCSITAYKCPVCGTVLSDGGDPDAWGEKDSF
ncbi:hypothetical protein KAH81_03870 [bacterium]|nr:hypothetical protein [bacterium]